MLNIKKILLPVDFPDASLPVICQAATLARHFSSEIVMLHVPTAQSRAAGVPDDSAKLARWDLLTEILRASEKDQQQSLAAQLEGLAVKSLILEGDPAHIIVQTAQQENAGLIMKPSHGSTFDQFLLGTVTAKVLRRTECPVWTGAHLEVAPEQKFSLRNVHCAVDLGPCADQTLSWASKVAAQFNARLTLAHVTAGVEFWGPGGSYVKEEWKDALVGDASRRLAELQQRLGIKADVFIGSGDVPKVLSEAAKQTNADLLVTGSYPSGGHLRTHGYAIICAAPIPVQNV
jgi:nucleotide-binding universal stress UspA family protein